MQDAQVSGAISRPTLPWSLVSLALLCSEEAYGAAVVSSARRCTTLERTVISEQIVYNLGRVVVVALSGTKGITDWMINLRSRACHSKEILVCGGALP